ncbi:MAG: hypothetical protein ABI596_08855 [Pyrinomonadaceae bacterium]
MKLSRSLYVGAYIVGIPLSGIMNVYGLSLETSLRGSGMVLIVFAYIVMFMVIFLWFHLYYKGWKAIRDGHARTTPARAVGFLLIPVFNGYWMFQAIWGFAKDYNTFIDRHSIDTRRLPEKLFLAYVITILLWAIPGVNVLAAAITLILNIPIMWKMCDAINAVQSVSTETDIPDAESTGAVS